MRLEPGILPITPHDMGGIRARLAEELAEVESRFGAELLSDLPAVNSLVTHVERYRGKMLRPMLVLVSGMAASPSGVDVTDAHRVVATVAEMVHMATLVHDDILDDAQVRRRGWTINHLRGNEAAVMLGDYLISHAYHLCSSLESTMPARVLTDATNTVCEGELLQLANRENWALDQATYFEIIRRKTASLCGTCCQLGSALSDSDGAAAGNLYTYGEKVGIAFQIVDDVLDLTGTQDTVGKSVGRDLEKGKLTLPLIHHLQMTGAAGLAAIRQLHSSDSRCLGGEESAAIRKRVESTGSLEFANQAAVGLIRDAKAAIGSLQESSAKSLLMAIADAVITRKF